MPAQPVLLASDPTTINHTPVKDSLIRNRYLQGQGKGNNPTIKKRRFRDLASFGGFGEVDIGQSNGATVLTVDKNALGRNVLQIGINATNDFEGSSSYSILTRLTRKLLSAHSGDFSLFGEFGTNTGLSAELYQPLGAAGRFFIQPEVFAKSARLLIILCQPIHFPMDLWRFSNG